ncbi:MAG: sigma-70 family RNA polymerase sigma factor [Acidimicrobiales bacterium]
MRSLPARQAQSIALRYLDDLSVAQIADVLDVAESTVCVRLHRGRIVLAQKLGLDLAGRETTTSAVPTTR